MKKHIILLFLPLLLLSCEKGKFKYVATLNESMDFQLDKAGKFSDVEELSSFEIAKNLLDLKLGDGESFTVTKVNVRDVKLNFSFRNGSNATGLDVNLMVTDRTGSQEITFANVSKTNLRLPGASTVAQSITSFGINLWLSENGVNLVKRVIEESLINTDNFDTDGIIMTLNGEVPNGEVLKALLKVKMTIDIEYETCEDVPFGVAGEVCG
jgi:hypothetical protein